MNSKKRVSCLFLIGFLFSGSFVFAQNQKKHTGAELYFSWGYNTEWYSRSNVKVRQPGLGNDYTFKRIKGHDRVGWDHQILKKGLTIPQYNYRLGYFLSPSTGWGGWGFEINFDHTKFIFQDGQDAKITGKLNGRIVDTTVQFSKDNGFYYYLNNGANFLLFNLVRRYDFYSTRDGRLKIQLLGKVGVGPVIPHVENSFFGKPNKPHFQLGGWNTGLEGTIKVSLFNYAFIEYANKFDYARYSNLKIYEGTAKHAFGTYEMILSAGVNLPLVRHPAPGL